MPKISSETVWEQPEISPDFPSQPAGFTSDDSSSERSGKIFYGWWIVVATMLVNVMASGIGFYGHSVLMDPLQRHCGWPKGIISSGFTVYFITIGIVGLFIGRFLDRYGPKLAVVIGSFVFGFSLVLLGHVHEIWQFFAVYVLMAAGYSGVAIQTISTLISNWFVRRRGFALSITMTGLSIGGIVMVPLTTWLIAALGIKTALAVLGGVFIITCVPIALFLFKGRPSDMGLYPDGVPPQNKAKARSAGKGSGSVSRYIMQQSREWTRQKAVRTVSFWMMTGAFFFALTGQVAFLIHQMSFLSETMGRAGAATAISLTAAASIAGRLALGAVVDRLDKRFVTMGLLLLQTAAILSMAYNNHVAVLYAGTFIFGLTMGSLLMMQSLITADCFGMVSFGTVYGLSNLFVISGSAAGPAIAGFIFDATNNYRLAFTIFAAMGMLGAGLVFFARPPE